MTGFYMKLNTGLNLVKDFYNVFSGNTNSSTKNKNFRLNIYNRAFFQKYFVIFSRYLFSQKSHISPNFLVWKFRPFARNFTETVPFHKISTQEN